MTDPKGKDASMDSHSKGGLARRDALTPEERSAIARKAADARWNADVPQATNEGLLEIGRAKMLAFVLPNGKRLLSQGTFLQALGRARTPKAGTGALSTADGLPFFLQAEALRPFISEELRIATTPIFFRTKSGKRMVGYDAELLPKVCEVYLKLRDAAIADSGKVPAQYDHIIRACDALMRGLATVGIIALVDEATGYQEVRDRLALQEILDQFLRKEFAAWAKRFPDEFYEQIFRLKGWEWRGMKVNRPLIVAKYTNDLVYARLAPGILDELQHRNPRDEKGNRKTKHHQWLTGEVGHPALAQHLYAVIGLMRASNSWDSFKKMMDKAYPKFGNTLELRFPEREQPLALPASSA
jgi:P63C domain